MAVTASFSASTGILSVFGDSLGNTIAISRNAAGTILVNGGAVKVTGGTPTVANTARMKVFGLTDNDELTLDESLGALPGADLFGGAGNDKLTGGSGADMLFGQSGHDILLGKGGNDFLFGGADNDILTGGDADDQMFGEAGDDRMIWNPGDDSDLMEGGSGIDTAEVNGGNGAENFTIIANGTRVLFNRLDPAPFTLDIGTTEKIVVNMNGGDDRFSATGNLAALIAITVDGGAGNDTILGGNGKDLLLGGDGNDFIDGQQGNDVVFLGAGDDVAQWDPGDGSDTIEGQDGNDTMLFNGSGGNEAVALSTNGSRVLLTRNLGNIVMDLNDVETVTVNALGGADTLTVNDLSGTDVTRVNLNLASAIGGTAGDAQADTVNVNATNGGDFISVVGAGGAVSVIGLSAQVNITGSEGANDKLVINALGGDDTISASALPAGVVKLTLDAGAGNDTVLGSQGADTILGGDGNDFVLGDNGNDVALLGAGDDVFQWEPGDGNDTIEGGAGSDMLLFFGSNASESVNILANGGRTLFTRDIAAVTMDLNDLERIEFRALGGADNITVGDLTGTEVTRIDIDLRGPNGGGDGAADTVTVNGTSGADVFGVTGDAGGVTVFGLTTAVNVFNVEVTNDRLVLSAGLGDDVINASSLEADGIKLTMNGGLGNDLFIGSEGDDLVNGSDGDDTALMGAGNDTFVWNPGDDNDTVEGQDGVDTLLFNGSAAAELIDISANGGRVLFTRNIAAVTMDLNEVETITFNPLAGEDTIRVHDLSGTDVHDVNINLAGANGSADNLADTIVIDGTSGDDVIHLVSSGNTVTVFGLGAAFTITNFDSNDRIVINGLSGDDVIEASGLNLGINFTADGGDGNDILVGGAGNDVLLGGAGDDVLIGGDGLDTLDPGAGDNVSIQSLVSNNAMLQLQHDFFV
jgi:Ca2+-binding RTX toxin-like protein